jgi:DNA-binding IclR family transcriptional regulator
MGSKEIAIACGIDPNAAFRQCATLDELGFLKEEGGKFVLGMGLALFWARKKSHLEGERDKIGAALQTLEMEETGA